MTPQKEAVNQAIADLALIRHAIEKANDDKPSLITVGANRFLQIGALAGSALLVLSEFFSDHLSTYQIIVSRYSYDLRVFGITSIGQLIILLLAVLYLSVFAAARKSGKDFNTYVSKNFSYLKNMSFVSDLLVKYVIIAMLILASQPEWVAPICTLFIGDYLVQGRFFTLPLRLSLTAGLLCIFGAGLQAYIGSPLLTWPALAALIASAASLWHLQKLQSIAAINSTDRPEAE